MGKGTQKCTLPHNSLFVRCFMAKIPRTHKQCRHCSLPHHVPLQHLPPSTAMLSSCMLPTLGYSRSTLKPQHFIHLFTPFPAKEIFLKIHFLWIQPPRCRRKWKTINYLSASKEKKNKNKKTKRHTF